jgi:hypothetical protein
MVCHVCNPPVFGKHIEEYPTTPSSVASDSEGDKLLVAEATRHVKL